MNFNQRTETLANAIRAGIQNSTKNIDQGESVSILVWYSFICDHARAMGLEPKQLAREQLEAFLESGMFSMVAPQ